MKIAVTGTRGFPGVQGGIEKHCEQLYTHLANYGCDVTVFTRKSYVSPHSQSYKGVSLIPVSCSKNRFLETVIHTFKCVLRAKKLKPDILHIHAIGPAVLTPLARILGMKVIVTHHGPDYKRKKWNFGAKIFLKFCEWIGMRFANEVIVIANNIADDIKLRFGKNVIVIPNGVDIPGLVETDIILKKFNLQRKRYFLAVGRFVPEKGFEVLIKAFHKREFNNWKLVIVGDADHEDPYSSKLKTTVSKNNNIVSTGFLTGSPLNELYAHAGLFVIPSYYEGLPIVLLEAMSYGLSCIASDIPANRSVELSEDRFFKAGDVFSLAMKMEEFINKPWKAGERESQFDLIAKKYNWEKIADETLQVYKKIVS